MNKVIYLARGTEHESYPVFSERILQAANEIAALKEVSGVKVVYTMELPPVLSIIPFKKKKVATISVYSSDQAPIDVMIQMDGFSGAYSVEEALPVAYQKSWPDLEMTPGICLLTLFNRKKGLDHATFIHRWHNSHTPLSLNIHPLWNYSRNVVLEKQTAESEHWEGIVEEQTKTMSELLNPFKFFGPPWVVVQRMLAVYTDTKSFLDYKGIETYLAREVVIRS
jgi:hypothetical protein